jgi:hypothetical protein
VTDESRTRKRGEGQDRTADEDAGDRPTVNPPFDLEAFARANTSPESPANTSNEAATQLPPPVSPGEGAARDPVRGEQITLTNELELERARAQSATHTDPPPRAHTHSALSIANARAPSAPAMPAQRTLSPTSIEAAVLGAIASSPSPEITERTIEDPIAEMNERFSLGDYTGALEMAELILAEEPANAEAARCLENCRSVLEGMYAARLGALDRAPVVVVPRAQMRWLSIDHRAGFVLSLIDGTSTVETILDMSGMPRLDALRILQELVQQKIVAFR